MEHDLKAWKCSDGEYVEIVYAATRSRARCVGMGRLDADEYLHVEARRAPEFDHMAPKGPSNQQLFEQFGWHFECDCGGMAEKSSGGAYLQGEFRCVSCVQAIARAALASQDQGGGDRG